MQSKYALGARVISMSLALLLFDFHASPPECDRRFDSGTHFEDKAFLAWLNQKSGVYTVIGNRQALEELRSLIGASREEDLEQALAKRESLPERYWFSGALYVRPKDFAVMRDWMHNDKHEYMGDAWDRQRLLALLDVLEADPTLWLYESV